MPRRLFYGRAERISTHDRDEQPNEREPTGMSISREGEIDPGDHELIAVLEGSEGDYYLVGRADDRCELWHILGGGGDPGEIYPQSEADRRLADRGRRRPYDSGRSFPDAEQERTERARAGAAQRKIEMTDRAYRRSTSDAERTVYGQQIGRLSRQRDAAKLRAVNLANAARYAKKTG